MIERFFEYLISKLYWEFRKENNLPFGSLEVEPVIRFGGFDLEEPYGKQIGLQVFFESKEEFISGFNAESLVEVVCHELAHAVLTDIDPKSQEIKGEHGKKHDEYTEKLRKLLVGFSEYQELKKFWK